MGRLTKQMDALMIDVKDITFFVPACGLGTRVQQRGEKPFLEIDGRLALDIVMDQVPASMEKHVALRTSAGMPRTTNGCHVHYYGETKGQADTINRFLPECRTPWILISNCDNAIDLFTVERGIDYVDKDDHGVVFTFMPKIPGDKRFSYVKSLHLEDYWGLITEIAEKNPISKHACAGVYLLRVDSLRQALQGIDGYLSEGLQRMLPERSLVRCSVEGYVGWGDLQQLEEIERGIKQTR